MSKYQVKGKDVIEETTGYTIKTCKTRKEALQFVTFLMTGGAFDGFTPGFILRKTS